jgi:hypothetical protein
MSKLTKKTLGAVIETYKKGYELGGEYLLGIDDMIKAAWGLSSEEMCDLHEMVREALESAN